ncbi:MAG: hypothetical protein HW378_850 [Anaerolineales bacterium]|jgi:hypothetical protein|nr:hypothetical protein [Anaerolineales bacterium]MBM2848628.1 hypothetical protein [Anaerolineales bacterium]
MLLDETPNTVGYMIAGYAVFFGLPFLYLVSWLVRQRDLEKDIELIETLSEEKKK